MTEPSGGGDTGGRPSGTDQFQARMEAFGRDVQVAGERFGREAEAAGQRLARDPGVVTAGVWFTRFWGLVLIAVGAWLFAEVSLGLDLPAVDWNLAWPVALILLGGIAIVSAVSRRR